MAYFDFVNNASGASNYGFINNSLGTKYYDSEEQVVTTTLPAASDDMYVSVRYVLPHSGNYINISINDVQVFACTYSESSAINEALFRLKQGDVLKITCKSYSTSSSTMCYFTF